MATVRLPNETIACRRCAELQAFAVPPETVNVLEDLEHQIFGGRSGIGDVVRNFMDGFFGSWGAPAGGSSPGSSDRPPRSQAREPGFDNPPRPQAAQHHPPPPPPRPRAAPPRDPTIRAREILGFEPGEKLTAERVKQRKQALARVYHPDLPTGSIEAMKKVNLAADLLLSKLA